MRKSCHAISPRPLERIPLQMFHWIEEAMTDHITASGKNLTPTTGYRQLEYTDLLEKVGLSQREGSTRKMDPSDTV